MIGMQVEAPKKKVKKTNIPISELVYGTMVPAEVQKAVEKEFEMALQDRVMEETKDRKNAVEAYVYDMRNKVRVPILLAKTELHNYRIFNPHLLISTIMVIFCPSFMTSIRTLSLRQRGTSSLLNCRR